MSVKYTLIKKIFRLMHMQKFMAELYEKLQKKFKTADAVPDIPKLSDPELDFEIFQVQGQ